jgi:hypothetical protein
MRICPGNRGFAREFRGEFAIRCDLRHPSRLIHRCLDAANLPLDSWPAGFENEIQ